MSFGEIFPPGLRHLREEKDRQKMLVSKPTPGGGSPFGIDLEAGVAKITVRRPAPDPEPTDAELPADAAEPADPTGPADAAEQHP
ncbi:hypothetical protein SAMN04488543_0266 [Friedmanniella luteola]|uniref:Uncharacterized protein n=1 Tax=Friedmanniella luteola TaxID=546871 RepID=A0A1H1LI51_9ACTN|nr:DUF6191 domain-containing protein [Friedmanniella luteola]SDR73705.1 hypothetical protein SAMN04488543_0266 [Friedmanniella luteola]